MKKIIKNRTKKRRIKTRRSTKEDFERSRKRQKIKHLATWIRPHFPFAEGNGFSTLSNSSQRHARQYGSRPGFPDITIPIRCIDARKWGIPPRLSIFLIDNQNPTIHQKKIIEKMTGRTHHVLLFHSTESLFDIQKKIESYLHI